MSPVRYVLCRFLLSNGAYLFPYRYFPTPSLDADGERGRFHETTINVGPRLHTCASCPLGNLPERLTLFGAGAFLSLSSCSCSNCASPLPRPLSAIISLDVGCLSVWPAASRAVPNRFVPDEIGGHTSGPPLGPSTSTLQHNASSVSNFVRSSLDYTGVGARIHRHTHTHTTPPTITYVHLDAFPLCAVSNNTRVASMMGLFQERTGCTPESRSLLNSRCLFDQLRLL